MTRLLAILAAFLALLCASPNAAGLESEDPGLRKSLEAVAAGAQGVLGAAVQDLATGRSASIRGDERFPMASVYKLPIAVAVLERVDRGVLRLDRSLAIRAADLRIGRSPIAEEWNPGMQRTVESLLRSMMVESDNTASDLLLDAVGGPGAVTARLRTLGITDIDVNRSELEMTAAFYGASLPRRESWSLETLTDAFKDVPLERKKSAAARFMADPRDTTTPRAMVALLARLGRRDVASAARAELLYGLMLDAITGTNRLRAGAPSGASVADKTGTCPEVGGFNCTNDVGLMTLPGRPGPIALAVFLKNDSRSPREREHAIADVARAVAAALPR